MAEIFSFNEAVIAAANMYLATGGLTPTFTTVTVTGGTVTTSTPVFNATQTWNNAATTFTGLKLNVTDTASASGSLLMDLQVGGASKFNVAKTGEVISAADFWVQSNAANAGVYWGSSGDVFLARDAANVLALRNGTAAQGFNIYNTYTDASNYERGLFGWGSNLFFIGTEKAGTGVARALQIRIDGNNVWQFSTAGHFLASTDNTYDIGAVGANRPRNIFAGSNIYAVTNVGANLYTWGIGTRSSMTSAVDGVITMANNAQTDFTRLILGTNDASGIAIKKNGTAFNLRLGDDSAWANLSSGAISSAGDVGGTNLNASATVKTGVTTVTGLGAAGTAGRRWAVNDSTVAMAGNFGATVAGGGSNFAAVVSDGTNWLIG